MNIETTRAKLRKSKTGLFRALRVGEPIDPNDIIVGLGYYDFPSPEHIGHLCEKQDTIIRLEFMEKKSE